VSLVTTLLSIIPVVGACLSAPLGIYSMVLNIRALQASHGLTTGRAIGVLFVPGIVIGIVCCLLGFVAASTMPNLLRSLPNG
jgi:hypothetical protein